MQSGENNPAPEPTGDQSGGDNAQTTPVVDGQEGIANEQINQPAGFQAALKEEYRGHEYLNGMGNINHMFEALRDSRTQLDGLKGRTIPGEDATEEDWGSFRKAMGVPESKDGYRFEYPEDMDKNVLDGMAGWLRDVGIEEGIPDVLATKLFSRWANDLKTNTQTQHEAEVAKKQEALMGMSKEYGDKWDNTLSSTKEFATEAFGEETAKLLSEMNLLDNPTMLKSLIGLKGRVSEDTLPNTNAVGGQISAERDAKARARSLFPETKYD